MPKVEIEIMRTVTVTREESAVVELDVPKRVIDEGDVVSWVDDIMEKPYESMTSGETAVHAAVTGAEWDPSDEGEEIEYNEANVIE